MISGRKNDSALPSVHFSLITVAIPREHDDERDFGEFGRLDGEMAAANPAVRAVAGVTDQRHEHQPEQNQREDEDRPREFFQQLIIESRRRHAEHRSPARTR